MDTCSYYDPAGQIKEDKKVIMTLQTMGSPREDCEMESRCIQLMIAGSEISSFFFYAPPLGCALIHPHYVL